MQRKLKDYLLITLKGMAMGAADTVPGVSGGTIAFITGIYEELINTLGKIDWGLVKTWKKDGFAAMWHQLNGNFLIALLSGIALSIFTLMRLAVYLLENYPLMVWAFFLGLVIASIWYVARQIKQWRFSTITALTIAAVAAYFITDLSALSSSDHSYGFLFLAGAVAVCAMILPGISGAYILLMLGAYEEITKAVSTFDFKKLFFVAAGIVIGLLSFTKLLKWLFSKYEQVTLAALTGFMIGSLNKIWPWKKVTAYEVIDNKLQILGEKSVLPAHYEGYPQLTENTVNPEVIFMHKDPEINLVLLYFVIGFALILILENIAKKFSS